MKLTFVSKQQIAPDIWTFHFKPESPVTWLAGQSIRLEIPALSGFGTTERRFTIVSAPYEDTISITTKLSESDFKQALQALQSGATIQGYGIEGDFIWQSDHPGPVILVANGIGITPYIAILKQLDYLRQPIAARLLYSNPTIYFAHQAELSKLEQYHPDFSVLYVPGEYISVDHVLTEQPDLSSTTIYIAGSETFASQLATSFAARGSMPANLLSDWFTGNLT